MHSFQLVLTLFVISALAIYPLILLARLGIHIENINERAWYGPAITIFSMVSCISSIVCVGVMTVLLIIGPMEADRITYNQMAADGKNDIMYQRLVSTAMTDNKITHYEYWDIEREYKTRSLEATKKSINPNL